MTNIVAPVVKRKDHGFPEFLNFKQLRKEGIEHIGQFSGDLWTDHNSHDPGVTILETLVYALMDLGYRSQFPIEELLAQPSDKAEQQFFSPAQILTNNPTTIMDYRKMLIDLPGVQNAWLEVDNTEVDLAVYIEKTKVEIVTTTVDDTTGEEEEETEITTDSNSQLICIDENTGMEDTINVTTDTVEENGVTVVTTTTVTTTTEPVPLNGLYKTHIQIDNDYLNNFPADEHDNVVSDIVDAVKQRLQEHRNLAEDFTYITVLCEADINACMEIDLDLEANPEQMYIEIFEAIQNFLAPEVPFYTLQQMLKKGKSIEEVFEGRPYNLDSYGFVDCDELEAIELRTEIHLSDLYKILADIEGVKMVRSIVLQQYNNDLNVNSTIELAECKDWVFKVKNGEVPVLDIDASSLILKKEGIKVNISESKIDKLRKQRLVNQTKGRFLENEMLDFEVPKGQYRSDLGAYYSIQNDLPAVYGIREGGIPKDSTNLRKAQALQLKGYLLFFDQLLAGYLSQLAHLGDLFSMQPDSDRSSDAQRSFFVEGLDSVPDVDKLLRFYKSAEQANDPIEILGRPVDRTEWDGVDATDPDAIKALTSASYTSETERLVVMTRQRKEFEQGQYTVEIHGQPCNYYYMVSTSLAEVVVVSKNTYEDEATARAAADDMALIASIEGNYRLFRLANNEFAFEVVDTHIGYLEILQNLIEKPAEYRERRNVFLNHLLARFNETFTDFALQLFNEEEKIIEYKAQIVSNYDNISRNRGRAFNYTERSWNTDNVSGIERQLAARLGFENWHRHTLCNFEIAQYTDAFGFTIYAPDGGPLFKSKNNYSSETKAINDLRIAINDFKEKKVKIENINDSINALFSFRVAYEKGFLFTDKRFNTAEGRDQYVAYILSLVTSKPKEEFLKVQSHVHHLELVNEDGKVLQKSTQKYTSSSTAQKGQNSFIKQVNKQKRQSNLEQDLSLKKVTGSDTFVDTNKVNTYFHLKEANYRWQLMGDKNDLLLFSVEKYTSEVDACDKLLEVIRRFNRRWKLIEVEKEGKHHLQLLDRKRTLIAETPAIDPDTIKALKKQIIAVIYREKGAGSTIRIADKAYNWIVQDNDGEKLLDCILWSPTKKQTEHTWREYSKETLKVVSEEEGWRVILAEKSGYVLAQSGLLETETIANERLIAIDKLMHDKKNIKYIKHDKAFGFNIYNPVDQEDILLESYHLFPTAASAVSIVVATAKEVDRKKAYFPIGDEVNLNFGFSIQNNKEHFLAVAPFAVPNEKVRTAALEESRELLKQYQVPFRFYDEFQFAVQFEEETVLKSVEAYDTPEKAYATYLELIHGMATPENIRRKEDITNQQYLFEVYNAGKLIATSNKYNAKGLVESRIAALQKVYKENNYKIQTTAYPASWKYDFYWKDSTGLLAPLFESKQTYASTDAACDAYEYFYNNISSIDIQIVKIDEDNHQLAFQYKEETSPFALSDKTFALEKDAVDYKVAVEELFAYVEDWNKAVVDTKASIYEVIEAQENNEGEHVYRLLNKGLPIAFSPCKCFYDDSDSQELTPSTLQDKYCEYSMIDYCELCTTGNIVIQEGLRYRYVVKAKTEIGESSLDAQIYFTSVRLYDTIAEAEAAFHNDFFTIIELASNADNYGPDGPILIPTPVIEVPDDPEDVDPYAFVPGTYCVEGSNNLICVPEACLDEYNLEEWVNCFCSYPIRRCTNIVTEDTEDCDPTTTASHQYHFQILGDCGADADDLPCEKEVIWKSSETYDTPEEAQAAFELFECLLRESTNYRFYLDDDGVLQNRAKQCCDAVNSSDDDTSSSETDTEASENASCCYYLAITEVLIESTCRYKTTEAAWGEDLPLAWLDFPDNKYISVAKACSQFDISGSLANWITTLNITDASTPTIEMDAESGLYGFIFEGDDSDGDGMADGYARSPIIYQTEADAAAAADQLKNLMADNDSLSLYRVYRNENCYYRLGLISPDECPVIPCKTVYQELTPESPLGSKVFLRQNCYEAALRKRGLEEFLEASCDEETFYPIADFTNVSTGNVNDTKPYSFLVVNEAFRLAKHPFVYNTAEDRDKAMDQLCACFPKNIVSKIEIVDEEQTIGTINNSVHAVLHYEIKSLIKNVAVKSEDFKSNVDKVSIDRDKVSIDRDKEVIESKRKEFLLKLRSENIPYREPEKQVMYAMKYVENTDFHTAEGDTLYILNNRKTSFLQASSYQAANYESVSLQSNNTIAANTIVATYHMADYQLEDGTYDLERMQTEIQQAALNYPYRLKNDQYAFQWYCDTFDPQVPYPDDTNPCQPCDEAEDLIVPGAVIWESWNCYETQQEVECAFDIFCQLIEAIDSTTNTNAPSKLNYYPANVLDCDNFEIILGNPNGIIARHPQWYSKSTDVEAAIQKTQLYSQTQGLHLIEHILLRPRTKGQTEKENCLLPVHPDDCELCCVPLDPDPCEVRKALDRLQESTGVIINGTTSTENTTDDNENADLCLAEQNQIGRYAPKIHQFNCDEEEYCERYTPGADPYSFIATIVLPNWTKKYNTIEGREAIQNMLRQHVPAHILLNILWLRPVDMCKIEEEYRKWLLWLRCENTCGDYDPCTLINCLMQAQSCTLVKDQENTGRCESEETGAEINISNLFINSMFLNNPDHLHNFGNIEGAIEYTGNVGYFLNEIVEPPIVEEEEDDDDNGGVISVITLANNSNYSEDIDSLYASGSYHENGSGNGSGGLVFYNSGNNGFNNSNETPAETTGGSGGSGETLDGSGGSGGSGETLDGSGGSGGSGETLDGSGGSGGSGGSDETPAETTTSTTITGNKSSLGTTDTTEKLKFVEGVSPKEVSSPENIAKVRTPEEERNIQKVLSTRTDKYNKQLEVITNKNINQSEYYHRTAFFLRNNSDLDSYLQLLQFFIDKNKESTRKTGLKNYTDLLKISTHYLLDRLVVQDTSNLQAVDQLVEIWEAIQLAQVDVAAFADDWDEAMLVENIDASVAAEYVELLKLIA